MHWTARAHTALGLAVALAVLPLVLDRCVASCDAHPNAVASTPGCHHASQAAVRMSHVPTPCGHDHGATAAKPGRTAVALARAHDTIAAAFVAPAHLAVTASSGPVLTHAPPGSSRKVDARSLHLRT